MLHLSYILPYYDLGFSGGDVDEVSTEAEDLYRLVDSRYIGRFVPSGRFKIHRHLKITATPQETITATPL